MQRVAVIGDGGWGTALALVLCRSGHAVTVWGPFEDYVAEVRRTGVNRDFLPGVPLPEGIHWTHDRDAAVRDAGTVVLAAPSKYLRAVATSFAGRLPRDCTVVSVAKGLEESTHMRMTDVAEEALGVGAVAAMSGPSHAEEVARGIPTAVTVACRQADISCAVQELFTCERFRVYTSDDVTGVELGGALKNVIAVAVGVSDGLGFGDNTRALLITRGLAEMTRLGGALGANERTFSGLSGMGDLIVTCTSRHSRNRALGERIGRGEKADDIVAGMKQVAEGYWNCASAYALASKAGVDVPVTREVNAIIHEGKRPEEAVHTLMARDQKPEH